MLAASLPLSRAAFLQPFCGCSEKVAKLELTFCEQMFCLFSLSRPFGVRMFVGCKCHCYQLLLHSWTWWECGSPGLPTNTDPVPTTDKVVPVLGNTKKNPTLLPYIYKLYVLLLAGSKLSLPALCVYLLRIHRAGSKLLDCLDLQMTNE